MVKRLCAGCEQNEAPFPKSLCPGCERLRETIRETDLQMQCIINLILQATMAEMMFQR